MSDTPSTTITVKHETEVTLESVVNAIIGAFEGGSTYWLREADYTFKPPCATGSPLYADSVFWEAGGKMLLKYDNPDEPGDMEKASKEIGMVEITAGLRKMAKTATRHFNDLVQENDDAETHDVFIQMVLFGEIIYG